MRADAVQDEGLLGAQPQQLLAVILDAPPDEPPQRDRGPQQLVDEGGSPLADGPAGSGANTDPVGEGALEPVLDAVRRLERGGIEHELGGGVGSEQDMAAREAGEVDIGEDDRVPDQRIKVRWPVGQVAQLVAACRRGRAC